MALSKTASVLMPHCVFDTIQTSISEYCNDIWHSKFVSSSTFDSTYEHDRHTGAAQYRHKNNRRVYKDSEMCQTEPLRPPTDRRVTASAIFENRTKVRSSTLGGVRRLSSSTKCASTVWRNRIEDKCGLHNVSGDGSSVEAEARDDRYCRSPHPSASRSGPLVSRILKRTGSGSRVCNATYWYFYCYSLETGCKNDKWMNYTRNKPNWTVTK